MVPEKLPVVKSTSCSCISQIPYDGAKAFLIPVSGDPIPYLKSYRGPAHNAVHIYTHSPNIHTHIIK